MKKLIEQYEIQEWLFNLADSKFDIDLGESGTQFHYMNDLDLSGNHHFNYDQDRGELTLRKMIAELYGCTPEEIVITHGSQEALYLTYSSVLSAGDHVITTTPGWQQSWAVPKKIGCEVTKVALSSDDNFRLDVKAIAAAFSEKTKMIIINSPNNPTGQLYRDEDLDALIALARPRGIYIVSDEEYLKDYSCSLASRYERALSTHSLSKVYGFPGLRTGWAVCQDKGLIAEVVNYKRYTTVSNSSLCCFLARQVIERYTFFQERYRSRCSLGLGVLQEMLGDMPSLSIIPSDDTPYVYVRTHLKVSSSDIAEELLTKYSTLVMPGEVFGDSNALRISIARDEDVLRKGLANIKACVEELVKHEHGEGVVSGSKHVG